MRAKNTKDPTFKGKTMKRSLALAIAALVILASSAGSGTKPSDTRPPSVAGQFYPADPLKLKLAIQQYLQDSVAIPMEKPLALIVPHAGYVYSGQICADAYRQVMGRSYDVVVLLGVNHTTGNFSGISLGDYGSFRTPLGNSLVDEEIISALLAECTDCNRNREVHAREHSIEVQLPFVQTLFPNARIVSAIIHPPDGKMCMRFGKALGKVLNGRRALIVISSDLSHYPTNTNAEKADSLTLTTIATLDPSRVISVMRVLDLPNLETRACGEAAILAGMAAAKALGATRAVVAGYANSGDVLVGYDAARTVGYGAVILAPGKTPSDTTVLNRATAPSRATPLQKSEKKILLAFARKSILWYLTTQTLPLARNLPARMDFPQGAFVTLRKAGQLRGCIGHIPGDTALGKTVGSMALQSAFGDSRFAPVELNELKNLEIEISVLTPMKAIVSSNEIVVGRDGVLMSAAGTSAVFLPQVATENHWDRAEMLDNLCMKAGLQAGCWKRNAKFQVFQADVFSESQFR
jgi:AmmeMemoRadiSam system protein B/AmmeMemoRadiSam system protein A